MRLNKRFKLEGILCNNVDEHIYDNVIFLWKKYVLVTNGWILLMIETDLKPMEHFRIISKKQYAKARKIANSMRMDDIVIDFDKTNLKFSDGTVLPEEVIDRKEINAFLKGVKNVFAGLKGNVVSFKKLGINPTYLKQLADGMGLDNGCSVTLYNTDKGFALRVVPAISFGENNIKALMMPIFLD